jgi:hypothetical protein
LQAGQEDQDRDARIPECNDQLRQQKRDRLGHDRRQDVGDRPYDPVLTDEYVGVGGFPEQLVDDFPAADDDRKKEEGPEESPAADGVIDQHGDKQRKDDDDQHRRDEDLHEGDQVGGKIGVGEEDAAVVVKAAEGRLDPAGGQPDKLKG